jgi:hypothetical protein
MLPPLLPLALEYQVWIVPVIGVASAGLALVMGRALLGRRRLKRPLRRRKTDLQATPEDHDPFVHGSATERRNALRRGGNPVPVLVTDADVTRDPYRAWVLDRSTGGLCLAAPEEVATGTVLSVRTGNAPDTVPWVQMEVKSCREVDGNWELGCQFVKTPNWNTMLLFG